MALILTVACSTSRTGGSTAAVVRVHHCLGDVVPLCTSVKIRDAGLIELARTGKLTISGRLTLQELEEVRRTANLVKLDSWSNVEPIGSFVTVETALGKRTVPIVDLAEDAITLLESLDRVGKRVFGRTYRPIVAQSSEQ